MTKVTFNDVDMMVIAGLSYIEDPPGGARNYRSDGTAIKPYSLNDMLADENVKKTLEDRVGKDALDNFMNKIKNQDYTIVKSVNDEHGSGFAAVAIEGPDEGTVTVAARGTEGFSFDYDSIKDVETDLQLGLTRETDQQRQMTNFMSDLNEYDSVYLTGHSLGGNLATHGAITFSDPEKIKGVYTYNAPGQNATYITKHLPGVLAAQDKIINYQTDGDIVSDINLPIGEVKPVKMSAADGNAHNLIKFDHNGDSFTQGEGKSWGHKAFAIGITGATAGLSAMLCVTGIDKKFQMAEDFISGIGNKLNELSGGKLGELIENTYNLTRDGVVNFVGGAIDFGKDAWNTTKDLYNGAKKAIAKGINDIKDGAKAAGEAIVDTAEKVGDAIVDGAKAVGNGIAKGAKAVGNGISNAYEYITGTGRYNTDLIFVNADGLRTEANKMRTYQQEYADVIQKTTNLIITLKQNNIWDAPATTTFIDNYIELKEVFDKFGRVMNEYASLIEGVSERMQAADDNMSAKFENLSL